MACYEKRCVVPNERGIHARPSGVIVRTVMAELEKLKFSKKDFTGKVFIRFDRGDARSYDVSSILDVMQLAAPKDQVLVVYTDNSKCRKAVDVVADAINNMTTFDKD